ncbi:MAG: carboxypeptidase-like regulatory domain-containing protein [Candidatus Eisenbacteria bacterium]|nr:carboxypeptidase-like regulatory domain-containing protein [Candidatus Eisenbacteria bacterium]
MTRDAEQAVSELERVQRAEGFRAERYLRIGHANRAPIAGHYFSSGGGKRWGQRVAATLTQLGLPTLTVGESAKYPIAQVSAVALDVSLARTDSSEAALLSPGRLRAEAYVLFVALAAELAADASGWATDSLTVLDAAGGPVAGAPVRLGGALVVQTNAQGVARFVRTEPGTLEVVVEDPRAPQRALLLDSERGRVLHAPQP